MASSADSTHKAGQVPVDQGATFNSPLMATSHSHTSEGHHPPDRASSSDSGLVLPAGDFTPIDACQTHDTVSGGVSHSAADRESLFLATPPSVLAVSGKERPYASEPAGSCPPSKLQKLTPSDILWKLHHPLAHPYATAATTSASQKRLPRSPVNGVGHVPDLADTTPRRYSVSGLQSSGTGPVGASCALKRYALASLPPLFSNELLQRKDLIKSCLQFKSEFTAVSFERHGFGCIWDSTCTF